MKKLLIFAVVFALAIPVAFGNSFAASAKATAAVDELVSLNVVLSTGGLVEGPWTTILTQEIKTANMKDLFIDVSLETGLYTDTLVRSKGDVLDESTSISAIRVRVVIDPSSIGDGADGDYALPDNGYDTTGGAGMGVTFNRRLQTLSAKLQGILTCPAGVAIPSGCTTTDEEIRLLLDTLSANSFNFVAADLSSGEHVVEVQARGVVNASSTKGSVTAKAYAGAGSVTIEEVRMIKGEVVEF
jgi:hypothetical protein